jgi:L-ascorbate metabolism protein UlaG (beta-lactamase superfamily)
MDIPPYGFFKKKVNLKILLHLIAVIATIAIGYTCADRFEKTGDDVHEKKPDSPRYRDGRFENDAKWQDHTISESLPLIWEYIFGDAERIPKTRLSRQKADLTYFNSPGSDQLNSTWLGHSSLMINIDGYKIIVDPVFEKRISIIGPTRFSGEIPLDTDQLPEVDAVVISHDHYDHLNKFSIRLLDAKTRYFVVPLSVGKRLLSWGIPREKIVELDWWEEYRLDDGLIFAATPAQHFSGRNLTDRFKTLWNSWVIVGPHHKIFYSGDSGYFSGFKGIGEKYGPFEMTFLECGAYNEKWHFVHMFPEETVQAHQDLRGRLLHPVHWGTFNLALHAWDEPMRRLSTAAHIAGIPIATPIVGETVVYGSRIASKPWWEKTGAPGS